ncbi:MAG: FHIPEP family type III secretion protein [Smithella sp.]
MKQSLGQFGSHYGICPRCKKELSQANLTFCAYCGLTLKCRKCSQALEDPLGRFCQNCGSPVDQQPWRSSTDAETTTSFIEKIPAQRTENLYGRETSDTQKALTTPKDAQFFIVPHLPDETQIIAYGKTPSLRQLRTDLGVALIRNGKFQEASELLKRALREEGALPDRFQILLLLVYAQESQGRQEEALRTILEAVLEKPEKVELLLANAHRLLTSATALSQGGWINRAWVDSLKTINLDASGQVQIKFFLARLNLFLDRFDQAVDLCREAANLSPGQALELSYLIVGEDALPPVWRERPDGNTQFILARLNQAIGRFQNALDAVDAALRLGLSDGTQYPDAPAYALRGEILLDHLGNKQEAAKAFSQSGQQYQWRGDYNASETLLRKSLDLDRDYAPTHWYLANTLYMLSGTAEKETKKKLLDDAWILWKSGFAIQPPDSAWSWVYVLAALLRASSSYLQDEIGRDSREYIWEAVAYIERAILLNESEARRWGFLGRYHNNLNNESTAVHATAVGMELNSSDIVVLEERASILANIGAFEEAEKVIDRRREIGPDSWVDVVKAFVLMHLPQRRNEAMSLVETVIQDQPTDNWYREIRAFISLLQGRPDDARSEYEFLLEKTNPDNSTYAWAAFNLDKIQDALDSYRKILSRKNGQNPAGALRGMGFCLLTLGNSAEARRYLDQGIQGASNIREIDEFLQGDIPTVERKLIDSGNVNEQKEVLIWARDKAMKRRDQLMYKSEILKGPDLVSFSITELQRVIEDTQNTPNWSWIGALAGIARFYIESERWAEAAQIYKLLLQRQSDNFPEASLGLERALAKLISQSDTLIKEGPIDEARELLTKLLSLVPDSLPHYNKWLADIHVRTGLSDFNQKEFTALLSNVADALQLYSEDGAANPEEIVGMTCRSLLKDPQQYWTMEDFFKLVEMKSSTEVKLKNHLTAIRKSLALYLDEHYHLSAQSGQSPSLLPVVTPIALEISQMLLPEDTGPEWSLLKTYIPQMRDHIERDTGIKVPGVRFRSDEGYLPPESYIIMLDEIPIVSGSVQENRRFSPSAPENLRKLGIPEQDISEADHPLTGKPGCWTGSKHWDTIINSGLELWDEPLVFMVYHLEAVIRRNLADFLGIQEVENLIEIWEEDEKDAVLVRKALPDSASRCRFARALRELAKERVPITNWHGILEVICDIGLTNDDVREAIRALRLRLKPQLPGNDVFAQHISVPPEIEAKISAEIQIQEGKIFLAMLPEETQEVLSAIRELVGTVARNQTLVVRDSVVRPFVRRLVELEWPDLLVLSQEEVEPVAKGGNDETKR